ncbi:MAG: hypothetical protein ACM3MD_10600 [Betaproteobacteria bacterium]
MIKVKLLSTGIILSLIIVFSPSLSVALTTDDMLRLKNAGISEETIIVMVESGYQDVEKVLKLKEAGFADQSILAIVKGEVKNNLGKERIISETTANAKIMWYLVFRGKPVLQNSKVIDDAKVSVVDNSSVKLEWKEKGGLGLLDELKVKAFTSPFYWVINKDDTLEPGEGYPFVLKSTTAHQGKPDSDGSHYWMLYLEPRDAKIADSIRDILLKLSEPHASK